MKVGDLALNLTNQIWNVKYIKIGTTDWSSDFIKFINSRSWKEILKN